MPRTKKKESVTLKEEICCFCIESFPIKEMESIPQDPWDMGMDRGGRSDLSCRNCSAKNRTAAYRKRPENGIFAATDLARWNPSEISEMVFKMLQVAERPPIDSTGFSPGESYYSNRPVVPDDIYSSNNTIKQNKLKTWEIWRADWANITSPVSDLKSSSNDSPLMPIDWLKLQFDDLAGVEALDELWRIAHQQERLNHELRLKQNKRYVSSKLEKKRPHKGLAGDSMEAERSQNVLEKTMSVSFSKDNPFFASTDEMPFHHANLSTEINPQRKFGTDGDDETSAFFEFAQSSSSFLESNERPISSSNVNLGVGLTEVNRGRPSSSSQGKRPPSSQENRGSQPQQQHFDHFGSKQNGENVARDLDFTLIRSADKTLFFHKIDVKKLQGRAGRLLRKRAKSYGLPVPGDMVSGCRGNQEKPDDNEEGKNGGVEDDNMLCVGGPVRVCCSKGKFFFPHHGALLTTIVQLARCDSNARSLIRSSLPRLISRAIRSPVRTHIQSSKASLYLLCWLAPGFRSELCKEEVCARILESLVGEEILAATLIQLFWKRRLARAALKIREDAVNQHAIDARKLLISEMCNERRIQRWSQEKEDRKAAIRLGKEYIERTELEEAELDIKDLKEVEKQMTIKEERIKLKNEKLGLKKEKRNPFQARQELMTMITKTRTSENWIKLKQKAHGEACVSVLNICILGAQGLMNSDDSGKSDPYVVVRRFQPSSKSGSSSRGSSSSKSVNFESNLKKNLSVGVKNKNYEVIYKSKVKNNNLNPSWNENFTIPIPETWNELLRPSEHPEHHFTPEKYQIEKEMLLELAVYDYDADGKNDSLGSAKIKIRLQDVTNHMEFAKLPLMVKTQYNNTDQTGEVTAMEVQKGWLSIGFCLEEAEAEVPKEVNLDMFRASMKLFCLLTEVGDWSVDYAQRNARHLILNGGAVPLVMGISGEFADDDLRLPEACTRIAYQLSCLHELCPALLRIVPDLVTVLNPAFPCTNATRSNVLATLENLSIPFVGFDERVPNVDQPSEANALRRSTVRVNEVLASVAALEAYCILLIDLAQPRPPALFEPPRLSKQELDMVSSLIKLLVTVTKYKVFPAPASKLMKMIMKKVEVETKNGSDDILAQPLKKKHSSDLPGKGHSHRLYNEDEKAALHDIMKLSPLLRTILGLLAEPEDSVDAGAVALLQQVMAYNYTQDDVLPLVIALQGVQDKAHRHALEELIASYGCEWREPDFLARNVSDILADDVTHLFEGPFIADNGRSVKEAACFTDAMGQGCTLLKSDDALIEALDEYDRASAQAIATTHIPATDIDDWILLCSEPLPELHIPSIVLPQQQSFLPLISNKVESEEDYDINHDIEKAMEVSDSASDSSNQHPHDHPHHHHHHHRLPQHKKMLSLTKKLIRKVQRNDVEMNNEDMLRFVISCNIQVHEAITAKSMAVNSQTRRSCASLFAWALTLAAADGVNEKADESIDAVPVNLLGRICRMLQTRCLDNATETTPLNSTTQLMRNELKQRLALPVSPSSQKMSSSLTEIAFSLSDSSLKEGRNDEPLQTSDKAIIVEPEKEDEDNDLDTRKAPCLSKKKAVAQSKRSMKEPVENPRAGVLLVSPESPPQPVLVPDEFGSFREANGDDSNRKSKAWRTAKRSVTVLSLAIGKRRRASVEMKEAKLELAKELESSRAVHMVRESCLLDPLIGAISSNAIGGIHQARAVLWLTSISDLLSFEKPNRNKIIDQPLMLLNNDINETYGHNANMLTGDVVGVGTSFSKEALEEERNNENNCPSRAPNKARLLVLHATASAFREVPNLISRKFGRSLISYLDVKKASLNQWSKLEFPEYHSEGNNQMLLKYIITVQKLFHFKPQGWWDDLSIALKSLSASSWHLLMESCSKEFIDVHGLSHNGGGGSGYVGGGESSGYVGGGGGSGYVGESSGVIGGDGSSGYVGQEHSDKGSSDEDSWKNTNPTVSIHESHGDDHWPNVDIMRYYVQQVLCSRESLCQFNTEQLKAIISPHDDNFTHQSDDQSVSSHTSLRMKNKQIQNKRKAVLPSSPQPPSETSQKPKSSKLNQDESEDALAIAGSLEAPAMMIELCAEIVTCCKQIIDKVQVAISEVNSKAEKRQKEELQSTEENAKGGGGGGRQDDIVDEETGGGISPLYSATVNSQTTLLTNRQDSMNSENGSDSIYLKEENILIHTLRDFEKEAYFEMEKAMMCARQSKHSLKVVLLLLRHLAYSKPLTNYDVSIYDGSSTKDSLGTASMSSYDFNSNKIDGSQVLVDEDGYAHSFGHVLPTLFHPTVFKSLFTLVRDLPSDLHDNVLALVSDLVQLNPELSISLMRDREIGVIHALNVSTSPESLSVQFFEIVARLFNGSGRGLLAPGFSLGKILSKKQQKKKKKLLNSGKGQHHQTHLEEDEFKRQELLQEMFEESDAQNTLAPDIIRCAVDHFVHDNIIEMFTIHAATTANILSFFADLVRTPTKTMMMNENLCSSPIQQTKKHKGHVETTLCDHILFDESIFQRTIQLLFGPSLIPNPQNETPSELDPLMVQTQAVDDENEKTNDLSPLVSKKKNLLTRKLESISEHQLIKKEEEEKVKMFDPLNPASMNEEDYNEIVTIEQKNSSRSPPPFQCLGHVAFRSLAKKNIYGKQLKKEWKAELKKVSGASGMKSDRGISSLFGTASLPNRTEVIKEEIGLDKTKQQCLIDERACRFICSAIEHPTDSENEVPKLVRLGCVPALARVVRRWNQHLNKFSQPHQPHPFNHLHRHDGDDHSVKSDNDELDGRFALHVALNALIRIAMSCRGKYLDIIAKSDCVDALQDRLRSMKSLAKKKHSTDYSEQSAMSAIEDVIALHKTFGGV